MSWFGKESKKSSCEELKYFLKQYIINKDKLNSLIEWKSKQEITICCGELDTYREQMSNFDCNFSIFSSNCAHFNNKMASLIPQNVTVSISLGGELGGELYRVTNTFLPDYVLVERYCGFGVKWEEV